MALNEIGIHFYEKEIDRLLDSEDREIIVGKFVDLQSTIDDLYVELQDRARRISELEAELERSREYTETLRRMLGLRSAKENIELANKLYGLNFEVPDDEEPLPFSSDEYEEEPVKVNLNDNVKVKLTPYGAEIYYHQYDELNKQYRRTVIEPHMPKIDKDGYTKIQLHHFMNLYGEHIRMCNKNVIEPLDIILCD